MVLVTITFYKERHALKHWIVNNDKKKNHMICTIILFYLHQVRVWNEDMTQLNLWGKKEKDHKTMFGYWKVLKNGNS